jgi:hypothetical protein
MRILSFHASYACRHSGACCSAGWIDPRPDGVCRHFEARRDGGCTIQHAHGHDALPHACRQFPRVATLSPLGPSVALSAFCPTAASLLFGDDPFEIVTIDDGRHLEGMDARGVMPPLLRDGMLMDWDAVARWETLAVRALSDHRDDVDAALAIIDHASNAVCAAWTPDRGPLGEALDKAFAAASLARRQSGAKAEIPDADNPAVARFLASHAFACWPMYQGGGIRGALAWLKNARATLEEECRARRNVHEAMRQADLRLRHANS